MGICDDKSGLSIPGHYSCISRYRSDLFYCIGDILSGLLCCQAVPGIGPLVSFVQDNCFSLGCFICIQLHLDLFRTLSILVVAVIPCLGHADAGLSWCIAVGNVITVNLGCIIRHCILSYRIYDLFSVCILRQVCKAVFPAIICCHSLACGFFSVCKKSYGNAFCSFSVLVVCIIPGLGSLYLCCLRGMGICDDKSVLGIPGHYGCISKYRSDLFYCVCNIILTILLVKIFPGIAPIITITQCNLITNFRIISIQLHFNAFWSQSVLIFFIIPNLCDFNFNFLRNRFVIKRRTRHRR